IGDDCCSECYSSDATEYVDREVQTDFAHPEKSTSCDRALPEEHELQIYGTQPENSLMADETCRDLATLLELLKLEDGCNLMNDREVQFLVEKQHIPAYKLESILGNPQ